MSFVFGVVILTNLRDRISSAAALVLGLGLLGQAVWMAVVLWLPVLIGGVARTVRISPLTVCFVGGSAVAALGELAALLLTPVIVR